ncbi:MULTISPECIES: DUF4382 domain-containing protein [Gammaproteobacteria]|uniref:DUF4382 domain-containing protein n=1 Tax=Gammaproteobacteria TaxID=1236 RepID=UPI000DD00C08|nr:MULTISPECIES: DUF4382 domain-containing protein [Gammaproteobacteria]RTE86425.1 DUF4382 domain-containing protein [Aliidiomarina sp. B3213]TCZ81681.1 DUF4382 domain-containing protein [Lysobacter sp. N42]
MNNSVLTKAILAPAFLVLGVAGCGSDSSSNSGPAVFSLGVSDAPVENANKVVVCFSGIELVGNGDPVTMNVGDEGVVGPNDMCTDNTGNVIPNTHGFDLLTLQGANSSDFIEGVEVEPGEYGQFRLNIADNGSYVETIGGETVSLRVPSNQLRLDGLTLTANQTFNYTLEFELRQALVAPPGLGQYQLKPRGVRLVDNAETGNINGRLDEALLTNNECTVAPEDASVPVASVYFYEGAGVAVEDMQDNQDNESDPYASVAVYYDGAMEYPFEIGFVAAGPYTLGLTCDTEDDPTAEDTLNFIHTQDIEVIAGDTLELLVEETEE